MGMARKLGMYEMLISSPSLKYRYLLVAKLKEKSAYLMWLEAKSCVQARKWRAWWRGGGRGGQVEDDIVYLMCQVARRRTWWPSRYESVYLMWLEARRRTWWPSWKMKAFGSQLWFTKKTSIKNVHKHRHRPCWCDEVTKMLRQGSEGNRVCMKKGWPWNRFCANQPWALIFT